MLQRERAIGQGGLVWVGRDEVGSGVDVPTEILNLGRKSNRYLGWIMFIPFPALMRLDDVTGAGTVE
jgi:hypothetical protein